MELSVICCRLLPAHYCYIDPGRGFATRDIERLGSTCPPYTWSASPPFLCRKTSLHLFQCFSASVPQCCKFKRVATHVIYCTKYGNISEIACSNFFIVSSVCAALCLFLCMFLFKLVFVFELLMSCNTNSYLDHSTCRRMYYGQQNTSAYFQL